MKKKKYFVITTEDYAEKLLIYFVNQAPKFYGPTFVVYNVHCLIHLTDDSRFFDLDLDKISCFPFENYLQTLKRYVRNATNPLSSIIRRVSELEYAGIQADHKRIFTKVSNTKRDSWFLLKNEKVICVKEIQSTKSFLCIIYNHNKLSDYFDTPCKSSLVGIFFLSSTAVGKRGVVQKVKTVEEFIELDSVITQDKKEFANLVGILIHLNTQKINFAIHVLFKRSLILRGKIYSNLSLKY